MKKRNDYKQNFEKLFEQMCYKQGLHRKEAWKDLMLMIACDISNLMDPCRRHYEDRVKMFKASAKRLGGTDIPFQLLLCLTQALAENPAQDFLGEMYMRLSMGEKGWGQVFTPYSICKLSAGLTITDPKSRIAQNGYFTILDPAVGGGAMLIASVQHLIKMGVHPDTEMIAIGQDIDLTAVNMAYIQLSLIGCPAVLVCGDTLNAPFCGEPLLIEDDLNYWYTPTLFSDEWAKRRAALYPSMEFRTA